MTAELLPIPDVEHARRVGQVLYFEYHCEESHDSADAELWYHSHQKAAVLGMVQNDGVLVHSFKERCDCGHPLVYRVRFSDGYEGAACEDELCDSESEYCRSDPPLPRKEH